MHTAIIKPEWSPVTIALMVLGFIIFWPLGLAMLAYILWGEYFGGSSEKAANWVDKQKQWARDRRYRHGNRHKPVAGQRKRSFRRLSLRTAEAARRRAPQARRRSA